MLTLQTIHIVFRANPCLFLGIGKTTYFLSKVVGYKIVTLLVWGLGVSGFNF